MSLLLLLAAAAAQAPAGTAEGFVQRLYASYNRSDFSPFKHPERVFAPRLLAAINEDMRLAQGEVGYLDGDPVCQCQDHGKVTAQIRMLTRPSRGTARVLVHVDLGIGDARDLWLTLVHTRSGWRIADIRPFPGESLLQALEAANRDARAKQRR